MRRQGLLAALALAGAALTCAAPGRAPDIVVITIDTLRSDRLGVYGGGDATPRIDAFAAASAIYEDSLAPMPMTRPSHFSMLTSLYPREHGVLNNAVSLPDDAETLTELLAERGYATGGFVGVKLLGPASGAGQGFHHFEEPLERRERSAEEVVTRALAWVESLDGSRPYFLWVHLFDPHLPYAAPGGDRSVAWSDLEQAAAANGADLPRETLELAQAAYRDEVRYVDGWVGRLLDGLDARAGKRLTIFTADHGECFERGIYFEHADCLWEGGIRIPMIVRYPDGELAGRRLPGLSGILDIAPTVFDVLGEPRRDGWSGRSMREIDALPQRSMLIQHPFYPPSAAEQRPARRAAMLSVAGEPTLPILLDREQVGLVRDGWKYIRTGESGTLYPRQGDSRDTPVEDDARSRELDEALERSLDAHPLSVLDAPEINPEMLEMLCALGYVECPDENETGELQAPPPAD